MKKKNILLAITGLSPQVVTETLYALYASKKTLPAEIIIITTQIGANEVKKQLIDEGKLQQFCDDYQLPKIVLKEKDICIIPDEEGEILNDINAQKQMNLLADFICLKVQKLTANENHSIHASLAGGRKTMTFFLGMAMSLYGRAHDTLSHVLVTEGYESSDFYYPTPHSFNIQNRSGTILDAKYAKVVLTEIPFVRLREHSPDKLLNGTASYSETVDWLNTDGSKKKLVLDTSNRMIIYCGEQCKLSPADFIFYLWFCQRAKNQQVGLSIPYDEKPDKSYKTEFMHLYKQYHDVFKSDDMADTLVDGMSKAYFQERKSRTNSAIKDAFDEHLAKYISINKSSKKKGKSLFSITLNPQLIGVKH